MEVYVTKVMAVVAMFVVTMAFGHAPLFLVRWSARGTKTLRETTLELMNCIAGGVFLSLFLIHLLPDVDRGFRESLASRGVVTSFPVCEFTVSMGFFFVFVFEMLFSLFQSRLENTNNSNKECDKQELQDSASFKRENYGTVSRPSASKIESSPLPSDNVKEEHIGSVEVLNTHEQKFIRALVMMLALSAHFLFEGLAVGLQDSNPQVWTLTVAVLSHKWVIAFGIGTKLTESCLTKCRYTSYMIAVSIMAPIGIVIGICVDNTGVDTNTREIVANTLESLAAGTILYVTFFEVLNKDVKKVLNVLFTILGFSVLTALKFAE